MLTPYNPFMYPDAEAEMIDCLFNPCEQSFTKLYHHYAPALFGTILKWIKDRETAENLLQDAFIKAWRNRHRYDAAKGRLFTWLYRIVRNLCIDYLRSRACKSQAVLVAPDENENFQAAFVQQGHDMDTIGLRKLVSCLRNDEKEVVELVYFKGLTQKQAARLMNIPLGTVKTRMNRAIRELRYYYKKDWKNAMRHISLN